MNACPQYDDQVHPLDPATTYHEILGVDERARETGATGATIWRVDLPRARTRFLQLQRIVHPDVQGNDATDAEMQAAVINKAWACLKDELARAKYCLHLYDADVTESEPATDPDLLMFVMETREQVDDAQSLEELDELATAVQAEIGDAVGALDAAFAEVLSPFAPDFKPLAADDPGLAAVRDQVIKLQYFYNIMEAIADRRAELD
ncbi:hypothetical protein GGF31_004009 [Allomyces arbusculus]|nr:hypothetical protein GGF31_004009 [Allomyces arbusculus]